MNNCPENPEHHCEAMVIFNQDYYKLKYPYPCDTCGMKRLMELKQKIEKRRMKKKNE